MNQRLYLHDTLKVVNPISYLFGCVFVFSGMAKLYNITSFADEIAQFADFYLNISVIIKYRLELAVLLPLSEILIGILSFTKTHSMLLSMVVMLLLGFFSYLTGINYFYPAFGEGVVSCGCFGDFLSLTPRLAFAKSIILLILSLINLFNIIYSKYIQGYRSDKSLFT